MNKHRLQDDFSNVPEQFHNRVMHTLCSLPEKKEYNSMKQIFTKKRFAIALASVMVLAGTAFAAGKIVQYTVHTNTTPTFTQIPTEKQLESTVGFVPVTLAQFKNGYVFDGGYVGNAEAQDENGTSVKQFKDFNSVYKQGSSEVSIYAQDFIELDLTAAPTETAGGVNLYYTAYTHRVVGLDYQKTEEDKAKEAAGELAFGVTDLGGKEPYENFNQMVQFVNDGVQYQVLHTDNTLTQEQLMEMAKELIGQ